MIHRSSLLHKVLLCLLFLQASLSGPAQSFKNLGIENGLSQLSVMSICQDSLGRMWFGTLEGINVYDGYRIRSFKGWINRDGRPSVWMGNAIRCLLNGADNNIYYISDHNLFRFEQHIDKLTQLTEGNATNALTQHNGNLWYARHDSLFRRPYDSSEEFFLHIPESNVTSLIVSATDTLYIGTKNGLYSCTITSPATTLRTVLPSKDIHSLFESSLHELWISTRMEGLYRLNNGHLTQVPYDKEGREGVADRQIRQIIEDKYGNIWIGTFSGLQKYNPHTRRYSKIEVPHHKGGLSHPSIFSLYHDREGMIWLGSYYGGVSYFNPDREEFMHYDFQQFSRKDLYYSYIGQMTKDNSGNLWAATDGGGLVCFNSNWDIVEQHTAESGTDCLPHNNIKSLSYDSCSNSLYIGTYLGGLSRYDLNSRHFHNYLYTAAHAAVQPGNVILHTKLWKGNLYLTSRTGLYRLDLKTNRFTLITPEGSFCEYFDIDDQGDIYLMRWNSIYIYSLQNQSLKFHLQLSQYGCQAGISHLLPTKKGLFICTLGEGLYHYNFQTQVITQYTRKEHHLSGDYCYAITHTYRNNYIITTDQGITLLQPKTGILSTLNLPHDNPIIRNCGLLASPEGIYVGDTKGVSFLSTKGFHNKHIYSATPYFSQLFINNQQVIPTEDDILQKALPFTHRITLKHNQNNCTFLFSAPDFKGQSYRQQFEYRLYGFDSEWIVPQGQSISYTNLDPGTYTLRLRPVNGTEAQTATLVVHIVTPWYQRWWACLLYLIILGSGITYFVRNRNAKRRLALSLEKERFEKQHIEELNQAKLLFFTNVSHEFRTPLTLIVSHTDSLLQEQLPAALYNRMLKIRQQAQYMTNLVSELLDFRKFTQGQMTLQPEERDFASFLREIYLTFADYSHQHSIDYTFQTETDSLSCSLDYRQMEKVFFNLLSNAFKYTPNGGSIHLKLHTENGQVIISVTDTGSGIPADELPHIFQRFFRGVNLPQGGTGIGLALTKAIVDAHHGSITAHSTVGQGSTFTVCLPIVHTAVHKDNTDAVPTVPKYDSLLTPDIPKPQENPLLSPETEDVNKKENTTEKKYTLLIVEDHPELLDTLRQLFRPYYHVLTATDGQEGLDMAQHHKPDLIVSDVLMPRMNGTELCLQIKQNIDLCHIPVILLTALNSEEQNIQGLNRGADDYITKPFRAPILLARVNNLLRNRLLIQHQFSKHPVSEIDLTSINPLDQEFLQRVSAVISQSIADPEFDINTLCQEVAMGRSQLFAKFKALTGMTPNNFLLNQRLQHAAALLQKYPTLPVAEVSDRSGFSTPVYFSRCFKNQYGKTPQQYRKEHDSAHK